MLFNSPLENSWKCKREFLVKWQVLLSLRRSTNTVLANWLGDLTKILVLPSIDYQHPIQSWGVFTCVFFFVMFFVGNALLFLLPAEESYVEFISINQKVWKWLYFLLLRETWWFVKCDRLGDWRFDNFSRSHLRSQGKKYLSHVSINSPVVNLIGAFSCNVIGWWNPLILLG